MQWIKLDSMAPLDGTEYSRMVQMKFVEDSL